MPVMGLRLYLNPERNHQLEIHLQHLFGVPKFFHIADSVSGIGTFNSDSYDSTFYEKVQGKNYDHVCTAPVESEYGIFSIVNGAQLHVGDHGLKKVLFLRLRFSELLGCTARRSEWESPGQMSESSVFFEEVIPQQFRVPHTRFNIFREGPMEMMPNLLKIVDITEMKRGPQESPGYWVVTGAKFVVNKGKISLKVKYSLPHIYVSR